MAFRSALNKEPALVLSGLVALGAVSLPFIIVPTRKALGLPTYQWYAEPSDHPMLNYFGDNHKVHKFDDPKLLSSYALHSEYKYSEKLKPKTAEERDFPEARERLAQKTW